MPERKANQPGSDGPERSGGSAGERRRRLRPSGGCRKLRSFQVARIVVPLFFIFVLSCAAYAADQKLNSKVPPPNGLAAIQQAHKEAETTNTKASDGLPDTPEG